MPNSVAICAIGESTWQAGRRRRSKIYSQADGSGVIGFCWWNEGWQNDDHKKHDTDMILLHDVDLASVFRDEFTQHADKIQETPIISR